jgi:hypothetical protein
VTKPLSKILQDKTQDIHNAMKDVQDCLTTLRELRDDVHFNRIFQRAVVANNNEPIETPRLTAKQKNRSNVPADNPEEYYKSAVYLPYIDSCISQMEERFLNHSAKVGQLSALLPSYCNNSSFADIEVAAVQYSKFLPGGLDALETEYMRWKAYWRRQPADDRPIHIVDVLSVATTLGTYPALAVMLRIFATIPVTTATGERSFSSLKYIKNYLRTTMEEPRLNGLAHLFINRDIELDHDLVVDEFAKKNRRLSFV